MRFLSLLLFVILVVGIVACGETKVAQCNRMNRLVNKISALPMPKDGNQWVQLSSQMSAIGAELKGLTLQDPTLVNAQQQLLQLTNEASRSASDLGKALQTQSNKERNEAITKIEQLLKKEAPIIDEINQYCSS